MWALCSHDLQTESAAMHLETTGVANWRQVHKVSGADKSAESRLLGKFLKEKVSCRIEGWHWKAGLMLIIARLKLQCHTNSDGYHRGLDDDEYSAGSDNYTIQ